MNTFRFSFFIILLLCQSIHSQQDTQQIKKQLPAKKPVQTVHAERTMFNLQFGADGSLIGLDDLNDHIAVITKNYGLPATTKLNNYYFVAAGISLQADPNNEVRLSGAVAFNKLRDTASLNYLQMHSLSLTYLFHIPLNDLSVYAGASVGMLALRSETTYKRWNGALLVNSRLVDGAVIAGVDYLLTGSMVIGCEGSYHYATTVRSVESQSEFVLKGIQFGLNLTVPLF